MGGTGGGQPGRNRVLRRCQLDDGGHGNMQQIVTLSEAIDNTNDDGIIVVLNNGLYSTISVQCSTKA